LRRYPETELYDYALKFCSITLSNKKIKVISAVVSLKSSPVTFPMAASYLSGSKLLKKRGHKCSIVVRGVHRVLRLVDW
jgi:hypothetical protein